MLREKEENEEIVEIGPRDLEIDLVKGRTDHRMNSGTFCKLDNTYRVKRNLLFGFKDSIFRRKGFTGLLRE